MKLQTLTILLPSLALAQSIYDDWHPPVPGVDLRGPCPGLNALANHGLIPRDGKNMTVPNLVKGLGAGLNMSAEIVTLLTMAALRTSSDPASGAFTLADLNKHNIIEHDGSLSRKDQALQEGGVTSGLDEGIFAQFLGYFGGKERISLGDAAAARWGRMQTSRAQTPNFTYTSQSRFSSYSETAIYYMVLQDPSTSSVQVDHLKVLFTEERLPYKEGWRPRTSINGLSVANTLLALAIGTPEEPSDLVVPSVF